MLGNLLIDRPIGIVGPLHFSEDVMRQSIPDEHLNRNALLGGSPTDALSELFVDFEFQSAIGHAESFLLAAIASTIQEAAQLPRAARVLQFAERLGFDLADAFAGDAEL